MPIQRCLLFLLSRCSSCFDTIHVADAGERGWFGISIGREEKRRRGFFVIVIGRVGQGGFLWGGGIGGR